MDIVKRVHESMFEESICQKVFSKEGEWWFGRVPKQLRMCIEFQEQVVRGSRQFRKTRQGGEVDGGMYIRTTGRI